ncbi:MULTISPECIES: hypothetical protein [Burkholderia]|uniref:hypothetical protein n=1 Tax=Burkholderia TaxID=32008 RepID=UPI00191589B9|nr:MULTISPECIES: hypothetical protein [Burkholderia]ELK7725472.1 hypothetical protein [Burkholderia cenocepacia]MBL3965961.1 hypothetical protein [Burkholderia sp. KCJ3K979]BEV48380.1 hypothetical protein BconGalA64_08790 [Burkholderia contaminans]
MPAQDKMLEAPNFEFPDRGKGANQAAAAAHLGARITMATKVDDDSLVDNNIRKVAIAGAEFHIIRRRCGNLCARHRIAHRTLPPARMLSNR